MDSRIYNCHRIISILAKGLTAPLKKKLDHGLGHFKEERVLEQAPAIQILPMAAERPVPLFSRHLNHIFGFTTMALQGRTAIASLHRGTPEFCLFFSSPDQITLLFRPVRGQENRFFGLVLFCIHLMARHSGMLMAHGAVAVKNGRAVIISGHHGMGKTPVLLSLLRSGWQCLGDDKAFLTPDGLSLVEPYVAVSQYHYTLLPWLHEFFRQAPASLLPKSVRGAFDRAAGRIWPGGTPVRVYRFLNPGMKIDLRQLPVPDFLADQARPVHWVILRQGERLTEEELTRKEGIGALATVQEMFFSHRMTMEKTLCLYSGIRVREPAGLLDELLPGDMTFSLITSTGETDIPGICEKVAARVP